MAHADGFYVIFALGSLLAEFVSASGPRAVRDGRK